MTEVHHINGEGDDAGVVYSEMQGVENKASNIIYFSLINMIYPGNSSYGIQTGGKLKNLRDSTNIYKVRRYHKKYYRPENMYITITGNVDPAKLFAALEPIERKLVSRAGDYPAFEKPFASELKTIEKDETKKITYPSEEEQFGWIAMAWRLPGKLADVFKKVHALSILSSYLSVTSISPLMKGFVDIPDPLATDVDIDILMNAEPAISIDFENVPLDKMDIIEDKFKEVLAKVNAEGIDLDRLHTLIKRMVLSRQMNLENSPHLIVPDPAVLDLLYGNKPDSLYEFIKEDEEASADALIAKPQKFWLDLMNETFNRSRVMTKAYPSSDLNKELAANETARVAKQRSLLGPEGMEAAGFAVQKALESQILPPAEVLKSIPIADVNSIQFRKLRSRKKLVKSFRIRKIDFDLGITTSPPRGNL